MALRDQPYLPLYVQDFMADEKLSACSAAATGVYIRLMCIMHKSEEYGKVCYNKRDNKTDNKTLDFAQKLAKQMPYSTQEIFDGLQELLDLKIIQISGEKLIQKRMVRDGDLSEKRAKSGKKGMSRRWKSIDNKEVSDDNVCYNKSDNKEITNTENEIEYENTKKKGGSGENTTSKPEQDRGVIFEEFRELYPGTKRGHDTEFATLKKHKDWRDALPKLLPAMESEIAWRRVAKEVGEFCPGWPHLSTWINQRRWEQELKPISNENNTTANGGNRLTGNERKYGSTASTKGAIIDEARELDRRRTAKQV